MCTFTLTWDDVLLFGCDGEKKEGCVSVVYTAVMLLCFTTVIYRHLYMT